MTNYISVPVPEEHVPAIYEFLAQLGKSQAIDEDLPVPPPEVAPSLTEDLVRRMYRDSESTHRALMEFLAGRQGKWVTSGEVIEALGLSSRKSLAGVFGAFGRRAKHRYGGAKPWEFSWDAEAGEGSYRMTAEVASWIDELASNPS